MRIKYGMNMVGDSAVYIVYTNPSMFLRGTMNAWGACP